VKGLSYCLCYDDNNDENDDINMSITLLVTQRNCKTLSIFAYKESDVDLDFNICFSLESFFLRTN
jgi:hypothetical protein